MHNTFFPWRLWFWVAALLIFAWWRQAYLPPLSLQQPPALTNVVTSPATEPLIPSAVPSTSAEPTPALPSTWRVQGGHLSTQLGGISRIDSETLAALAATRPQSDLTLATRLRNNRSVSTASTASNPASNSLSTISGVRSTTVAIAINTPDDLPEVTPVYVPTRVADPDKRKMPDPVILPIVPFETPNNAASMVTRYVPAPLVLPIKLPSTPYPPTVKLAPAVGLPQVNSSGIETRALNEGSTRSLRRSAVTGSPLVSGSPATNIASRALPSSTYIPLSTQPSNRSGFTKAPNSSAAGDYFKLISGKINQANTQLLADAIRAGPKQRVSARFLVDREGKVLQIESEDRNVRRIIELAQPFPSAPETLPYPEIWLTFPVEVYR